MIDKLAGWLESLQARLKERKLRNSITNIETHLNNALAAMHTVEHEAMTDARHMAVLKQAVRATLMDLGRYKYRRGLMPAGKATAQILRAARGGV